MISKREQNKRDTNDRLLSAARILFSAQGFASTTVDDIAERAEVSRATFFNYFQGKDSVLEALHSDHLDQLAALVDQLMDSPMPTADRISRIFQDFAQQAIMHPRYLRMVTAELERDFASSGAGAAHDHRFHVELLRIVTAGIEAGEVRSDYPPLFLAQMIGGTYGALVRFWRQDADYDVVGEFDRGARYVAEGIAAR
ncbi:TetR/AcrR family transcriptional regulator [Rhodococcus sp. NPDC055024]